MRRENPAGTVDAVAADYGLTNGEARGVVYATASRSTLNKVLKAGGWALAVDLIADLLGEPLEHFIESQAAAARREAAEWAAREARFDALRRGLSGGADG